MTDCAAPDESALASGRTQLARVDSIQILEIRGGDREAITITAAIAVDAIQAICTALSEQLDRHAQGPTEDAEDVLTLREHTALVERFRPLAAAGAHAVVTLSPAELRTCVLELARYVERVDDDHYQEPDLRARLRTINHITPVLWEANAAAAAAIRGSGPTASVPEATGVDGTE